MSSQSGVPKPNPDPSYALGDLELAPLATRPSLQTPRKPTADLASQLEPEDDEELTTVAPEKLSRPYDRLEEFSRGNGPSELDSSGFDGFGDDDSIELDLPRGEPHAGRVHASFARGSLRPDSTAPARPSASTAASVAPRASSRAPRSGSPRDDERKARELADFGEPDGGFGAPAYVLRVAMRMVALYGARRKIEQRASELAERYEQALRDLGRALLDDSAVTQHESLRDRVLVVQTRQGELQRAEEATLAARARQESELLAIKQKADALDAELAPYVQAEQKAESTQAALEAELKRKKAKLQRAEIELRALTRASLPPPPERLQSVEAERAQQESEIAALHAQHTEATAALGRARRELALRRGSVDHVGREQEQKQQEVQAQSRVHEEAVARAEHALSSALCTLAEAADELGLAHSANEQVEGLRASEKSLDDVVDQLAQYDRALTVYDRPSVLRGSLMWLALLSAIAVALRVW